MRKSVLGRRGRDEPANDEKRDAVNRDGRSRREQRLNAGARSEWQIGILQEG